jgi:hypothetical protein
MSRSSGASWRSWRVDRRERHPRSARGRRRAARARRGRKARPRTRSSRSGTPPMPWSNSVAWIRTSQLVRSSTSVLRSRVRVRHSRTCAGGIQASGSRPSASSVRSQRASWRSVLARRLAAAACPRLGRLSQLRDGPSLTQRLTHEQPARAGLDRDVDPLVHEAPDPTAHGLPVRRNASTVDLARLRIERVEGDLSPVHVKPGYDRHWASYKAPTPVTSRECLALSGEGPGSCHLLDGLGAMASLSLGATKEALCCATRGSSS